MGIIDGHIPVKDATGVSNDMPFRGLHPSLILRVVCTAPLPTLLTPFQSYLFEFYSPSHSFLISFFLSNTTL